MHRKGNKKKRVRIGVYVYCSREEKTAIEQAAHRTRRSVTKYILNAALRAADLDLRQPPATA